MRARRHSETDSASRRRPLVCMTSYECSGREACVRGVKRGGSTGQNGTHTHATKKRGRSPCHARNYCLAHLTMLRRHTRTRTEIPRRWAWGVALVFSTFFSFYFFYLLFFFFFLIYIFFFFAKIPKAGQTHRKQATGTVTKHSSAVKILKLTTVRAFDSISVPSLGS